MNHFPTNLLLLLTAVVLPLNIAAAQVFPPTAQTKSNDSDPVADADFYLKKSETQIAELQTFVDSLRTKNDLQQFPYRPVMFSKRYVQQAAHTLGLAENQIDQLPDNTHGDKRYLHKRLSRRLRHLRNYLQAARTSLQASLEPKAFPNLKSDAVRLRGIGMMLANLDSFETDPQLAATIHRQLPAAQQEADRVAAKYDLLIQQETIAGLQLAGLVRYFDSKRKSFEAIAKQKQQALPPQNQNTDQNQNPIAHPTDNYTGDDRKELLTTVALSAGDPKSATTRIPANRWKRQTYWQYKQQQWREIDQSVLTAYSLPHKTTNQQSTRWQAFQLVKDHLNDDAISVRREP